MVSPFESVFCKADQRFAQFIKCRIRQNSFEALSYPAFFVSERSKTCLYGGILNGKRMHSTVSECSGSDSLLPEVVEEAVEEVLVGG